VGEWDGHSAEKGISNLVPRVLSLPPGRDRTLGTR